MVAQPQLVCRSKDRRILIDAAEVAAVRELDVHPAPPTAPDWVAGIALEANQAVLVVRPDARAPHAQQRVAILRTTDDANWRIGIAVDSVEGIQPVETVAANVLGADTWLQRQPDGSLRVDGLWLQATFAGRRQA